MLLANGRLYTLDAANTVVDTLVATWNAFASHQEEDLGALTPGKRADLIVCSDGVFTCPRERIKEIAPLLTMVGGEVVYTREDSPLRAVEPRVG